MFTASLNFLELTQQANNPVGADSLKTSMMIQKLLAAAQANRYTPITVDRLAVTCTRIICT
jgi:hypothetical protein